MDFNLIGEYLWAIIAGIIITLIAEMILEMIPYTSNLRFKFRYFRKKIYKWIKNERIETEFTIKSQDLTNKKIDPSILRDNLKKSLSKNKFKLFSKENNLKFEVTSGKTKIDVQLNLAYEQINEDDKEINIVSQIETILSARCGYRIFNGHILDLKEASKKIEERLRENISDIKLNYTLMCKLRNLYELTGVLSKSELDVLVAKDQNYEIEMFSNRVIAYGDITQNLTTILKDLIVIYN